MTPSELPQHKHLRLTELRSLHFEELNGPDAQALQARVQDCQSCQSRLQALKREAGDFADEAHIAAASAEILQRLESAPTQPSRGWAWLKRPFVPALVAVAALLLVVLPMSLESPVEPGGNRIKGGGVGLSMFVKAAEGVRPGKDGEHLSDGDQIQFRYAAGGHGFLTVVSIDRQGAISSLYPEQPGQSISVQPKGSHVLQGSIILDDSVGPERIYAVFSSQPISFAVIEAAARSGLGNVRNVSDLLELPLEGDDVAQSSILIVKE